MAVIRVSRKIFATYRSISQAIMHAESGSRIEVEPGVYKEDIYINKYIEIVGVGDKEDILIQGVEQPTIYMATGYAVIKNITIKQPRKRGLDTVYIPDGALILDGCIVTARSGNGVTILGNDAEPIFRRCDIFSEHQAAVEVRNHGKVILEDCHLSTGDYVSLVIREGNPTIRRCTITSDEGYGVYVQDQGKGVFENCNIYGFDYSPAIGILRGNPHFIRCRIHDCRDSGVVIEEGRGRFQDCHFFSFDKEFPAIRLSKKAQPRFEKCVFHNCKGGGLLFESGASGLIEDCDCYGFTHAPAITIQTDAHPQIIRSKIHDGNYEGVVCKLGGKGLLESCHIYSFNGNVISITDLSQLDLLRCEVSKGNGHGILIAQKSKGTFQDTKIEQFTQFAAIHVTQAADPKVINCHIRQSINGVKVTENGHGLFEKCVFSQIDQTVWEIEEGNPQIHLCQEEGKTKEHKAVDEPLNVSRSLQKWLHKLGQIIGQEQMKKGIRDFTLYLDYLQDRKQLGIKTTEQPNLHAVFVGPEQTGKPEVAVIYGELLKELSYVPDAAVTTISVAKELMTTHGINQAVWAKKMSQVTDGLLYIHEVPKLEKSIILDQFLPLLKTFLDTAKHLNSTVVILSVQSQEWNNWCEWVPALGALRKYHFQDYSPDEMAQLFHIVAEREDYTIHITARDVLAKEMTHLWNREDGKGHLARIHHYFEQVKVVHSLRCSKLPKHMRTKEMLTTIMPEDLRRRGHRTLRPNHQDWVKNIRKK